MLLLSLFLSCDTTEYVTINRCDVHITSTDPVEAIVGQPLLMYAYPLTETWDTSITFNTQEAEVLNIYKEDCQACEECRDLNACTECNYCDVCDNSCQNCQHSVEVLVPELFSDSADILIHNVQGSSDPYSIAVSQE